MANAGAGKPSEISHDAHLKEPTYFSSPERATIAAAMARIIPTDDTPGAREAGTIDFLERYLSGIGYIYASPDGSGFEVLDGKRAAAWTMRVEILREKYRDGVAELNRISVERFGEEFATLTDEHQDQMLGLLEESGYSGRTTKQTLAQTHAEGASEPELQVTSADIDLDFFPMLVAHTRQGFYADPIYGGNRRQIGWQVIGFPGPSSLAEVHSGRYSTLDWFAENPVHPTGEEGNEKSN